MRINSPTRLIDRIASLSVFCFCAFFLFGISDAFAATYYVSPSGRDSNSGTSSGSPWQTISKINTMTFKSGDRILFEGGKSFSGSMYFDQSDSGTATSPIEVSSYGTGRAVITSGASQGIFGYNTGGFLIKNINFVGGGYPSNAQFGIGFYADLSGNLKLPSVSIESAESSGYKAGISIGSWNGTTGFNGIKITNSKVFNNAHNGISIYGYSSNGVANYAHEQVYISNVLAYDNSGIAGHTSPSGSGILLGQVNHAVIERSVAYNNGAQNTHDGGPVGIWAYGSNDVLIQHNESHHNRTNSAVDGGGFDLDGGTTNSIMQYNYSHDNDGHGYLLAQYPGAAAFSGNIVRYNISQNDGRKNGAGGISIWNGNGSNGIGMSKIYNNTVYMDKLNATTPSAVLIIGDQAIDAKFSNNIFITKNGARHNTLYATSPSNIGVKFENNNYYAVDGSTQFTWGASAYSSLATWRTGTGQETVSAVATGFNLDPKLMNAGLGATLNDANELERMNAYELTSSSPMIGKAYSSAKLGATPVSLQDFNGDALPQGTSYDMGADEFITTTTEVDTIAPVSPTNVTGLGVTDTRIDLSWNASSDNIGVVGYSIYRAGILVGSSPTTSYTDEGLAAASAYSYSVVAYDAAGNVSAKSTSVSISTLATDAPVPDFSFGVGAGIQTIADTVVMSKPGAGKKRGVQFARAVGTISSGPKTLSGTVWWQVDFTTSVDGWVMEDTLELTAIAFEALPQKNFFSSLVANVSGTMFDVMAFIKSFF